MCEQVAPKDVCMFLHELYTQFDQLCDKHGVYKVEVRAHAQPYVRMPLFGVIKENRYVRA